MSLPEQGAKVATGIIDALKSQPALLLLVIFNALVLVIVFYGVQATRTAQNELIKNIVTANDKFQSEITNTLLTQNGRMAEMLSHCIQPEDFEKMRRELERNQPGPRDPDPPKE